MRQMTKRAQSIVAGATLLSIVLGNLLNFLSVLVNLPFTLVGGVLAALFSFPERPGVE